MTTTTKALPLFQRVRAYFKLRKVTADDNIERSEPETMLASANGFVTGLILTALYMMISYAIMSGTTAEWIGTFLAYQKNSFTFDERLAGFTAAFIALVNIVVILGIELGRNASHDDIVDVVNDLGEQIDERFAEVENDFTQSISSIEKQLEDITVINQRVDDLTAERK